jgi:hypothetical protein
MVAPRRVQVADLARIDDAQLGVEVGQRLVEEKQLGFAHDGAADGHALALAAGKLPWALLQSGVSCSILAAAVTLLSTPALARPGSRGPNAMLSYTLMCGYSAYDWNTMEQPR